MPAGATGSWDNPVSVLIDLAGADTYEYNVVADAQDVDDWLPSDEGGRFVPVLPGVENAVRNFFPPQPVTHTLGLLDRAGADEDRPANPVYLAYPGDQRAHLVGLAAINTLTQNLPPRRPMGPHLAHVQTVNPLQFAGDLGERAGRTWCLVVDGGQGGVMSTLWRTVETAARDHRFRAVEWIVLAANCAKPNPKVVPLLERFAFELIEEHARWQVLLHALVVAENISDDVDRLFYLFCRCVVA